MTQLTLTTAPTTDASDREAIVAVSHTLKAAFAAHIAAPTSTIKTLVPLQLALASLEQALGPRLYTASLRSACKSLHYHALTGSHARAGKALRHLGVCLRHSLSLL